MSGSSGSNSAVPTISSSVPVHEYWLEHRRAMSIELSAQRDSMLREVAASGRGMLLGLDVLGDKLERAHAELCHDGRAILDQLQAFQLKGSRQLAARERSVFELQRQCDQQLVALMERSKTLEYERISFHTEQQERVLQLEQWASDMQKEFLSREADLASTSRSIEHEMGALYAARKKLTSPDGKPRHVASYSKVIFPDGDMPRVVPDQPIRVKFRVTPHETLQGVPMVITYLEGKGGSVGGQTVTTIGADGGALFTDLIVRGPPGTSHVILVSVPRVAAGSVDALELVVHIRAPPSVRATGSWNANDLTLSGRLQITGVEPYGLLGQHITVCASHVPSSKSVERPSAANELNEFLFNLPFASTGLSWRDIVEGKVYLEAHIPASKYTSPFFHRFQIVLRSESFPSFQYPVTERQEKGLASQLLEVSYAELVTDVSMSDGGELLATADVGGCVTIHRFAQGGRWAVIAKLEHPSFVSVMSWSSGPSSFITFQPRRQLLRFYSVNSMLIAATQAAGVAGGRPDGDPSSSSSAAAAAAIGSAISFREMEAPPGAVSHICAVGDDAAKSPACVASVDGRILLTGIDRPVSDIVDHRSQVPSALLVVHVPRLGQIAIVGYSRGDVLCVSLGSREQVFMTKAATSDEIVSIRQLDDDHVVVAARSSLFLLVTQPSWSAVSCFFRSPSPIESVCALPSAAALTTTTAPLALAALATATAAAASSGGAAAASQPLPRPMVMVLHGDGNVCVLSLADGRVTALASLRGQYPLARFHAFQWKGDTTGGGTSVNAVACAALRPSAWRLELNRPVHSIQSLAAGGVAHQLSVVGQNVEAAGDDAEGGGLNPSHIEAKFQRKSPRMGSGAGVSSGSSTPRLSATAAAHSQAATSSPRQTAAAQKAQR